MGLFCVIMTITSNDEDVMKRLKQDIKNGMFSCVYVVYGIDHYLYQNVKTRFLKECVPVEEQEMNTAVYNLQDTTLESAIEDAESFSFFGDKKVVFIENALFLTGDKTKGNDQNTTLLERYIANPNEQTILVLAVQTESLDKRKKLVKLLQQTAQVVEVNPLTQQDIQKYVIDYADEQGVTLDKQAQEELLVRTQANLGVMIQAIDKLIVQVFPQTQIVQEDVINGVQPSLESNVFALSEYLVEGKVTKAIEVYRDLILQKEEPIKLLAILLSQYRLMYHIELLRLDGYQLNDIASFLKQHPYRVQVVAKQSSRYHINSLEKIITLLIETDYQLKSHPVDKNLLLELVLLKISEIR